MYGNKNMITVETLKNYYPFNKMADCFLDLLLAEFSYEEFDKGQNIFELDDNKVFAKYVIEGTVEVSYSSGRTKTVKSTSMQSYYPIGDVNSEKQLSSSVLSEKSKIMLMDNIFLDQFIVWSNLYTDLDSDNLLRNLDSYDWVVGLLKSKAVKMLPRGHVDQLFKNLELISVQSGEEVIAEGDVGDYCYVIVSGEADVYKCVSEGEQLVATLGTGTLFGEHALVSKEPRTASVRMKTDSKLMRLIGDKFSSLLKSHVVRWITTTAAVEMINNEGATLVDVREGFEFDDSNVPDSINIPIDSLRDQVESSIDKSKPVLMISNAGTRCASAAFLLATLGYDVYSIQGGIRMQNKTIEKLAG